MKTLLFLMLLAVPAMAQNPDVPNSALALDIRAGTTGTVIEDRLSESRFLLAVIMPITERFTVTAKMENRRLDLKEYRDDGFWEFDTKSTFWEIGFKFYIGNKD